MNYFIVYQNKTYNQEYVGKYLFAPKKSKEGRNLFYYDNMLKVRIGDIIFSSKGGKIVSINIAISNAYDAIIPKELGDLWEKHGRKIDVEYLQLKNKMPLIEAFKLLREFLPDKYSPFTVNGTGNQGYLFELSEDAGLTLTKHIGISDEKLNDLNVQRLQRTINTENDQLNDLDQYKDLQGEEKEALLKIRVGHRAFKALLMKRYKQCAVCGLNHERLLIASHIKPWSQSDKKEKVDVFNGLLLCPNHDAVFDKGLVSFLDDGKIIISSLLDSETKKIIDINEDITINVDEKTRKYLKWNRENMFIK